MPTKRVKGKKKLKSIKAKQTDAMGSKRRLAKFGKEQRKGMRGSAANYITRSQALKRLQVSLKDFRRLCILKGIYPREPKKKPSGKDKTYYYLKDVMFLAHEPVLEKFRAFKTFMKKVKKAMGKKDYEDAKRKHENRPTYELDHIVKERYPRFVDALGDLDDALCLVHLFALMPTGNGIHAEVTSMCLRLVREWQNYVVATRALTKVFVSIKGIYYQANVQGQTITWLVPHQFTPTVDKRVDVRVMLTFLEFYEVLLKFVNAQLYLQIGVAYPPKINLQLDAAGAQLAALELERLKEDEEKEDVEEEDEETEGKDISQQQKESEKRIKTLVGAIQDDDVEEYEEDEATYGEMSEPLEAAFASNELAAQIYSEQRKERSEKSLFSGLTFFLSREVPSACLELVLRSHGATLGWDGEGSPFDEKSSRITHHIMDRPHQGHRYFNREYVQPQWVFDSVNNGMLLPLTRYVPGAELPPHLSPFVNDQQEGYTPEYRKELEKLKSASQVLREVGAVGDEGASDSEEEDAEEAYAADLKAEMDGKDAKSSDEEDEESDDEEEEEEKEEKSLKRKADTETTEKKSKRVKKDEEAAELKELAKTMMSKKAKRLYDRMQYGLGKKADKIQKLEDKRAKVEAEKEKPKETESASTKEVSKKRKRKTKGKNAN
ncbi:Pescadillo [Phytophthora cactorum]|uniref:Pescadillo homolog n=1 Tax=Phytophthora cactorum TaxID=29920 RepID=A0A329S5T3_9STRA|nr:Pescadillo [Phytophthora cactorum]KAG2818107.1 Pescadillo [Phytophthora cactorum]KAG2820254.1 Pescadillo [Phytophthora cactorum]KAG2854396.1 Pescadillo [Phytophthora cactorum]KAG2899887.1 Pescadillo [Phytophthora cactorum]